MSENTFRRIPTIPGKVDKLDISELSRQLSEQIYAGEGRRGPIKKKDRLEIHAGERHSVLEMKAKGNRGSGSVAFSGRDNSTMFIAKGAHMNDTGAWIADDTSTIIQAMDRDNLSPLMYRDTGLTIGQVFTPTLVGGVVTGSAPGGPGTAVIPPLSLDDLTDVTITAVANGDILVYNTVLGQWENVPPSAITGALNDQLNLHKHPHTHGREDVLGAEEDHDLLHLHKHPHSHPEITIPAANTSDQLNLERRPHTHSTADIPNLPPENVLEPRRPQPHTHRSDEISSGGSSVQDSLDKLSLAHPHHTHIAEEITNLPTSVNPFTLTPPTRLDVHRDPALDKFELRPQRALTAAAIPDLPGPLSLTPPQHPALGDAQLVQPRLNFDKNGAFVGRDPTLDFNDSFGVNWNISEETAAVVVPNSLTSGIISYWKMDEASGTRVDSLGTNNLTSNNAVGSTTGIISNAATFVSASSQSLSKNPGMNLSGGFTLAAWVNSDAAFAGVRYIAMKWADNSHAEFSLSSPAGFTRPQFVLKDGAQPGSNSANAFWASDPSGWFLVVVWYDKVGNQIGITVNNAAPVTSAAAFAGAPNTGSKLEFGAWTFLATFSTFSLDEVGLWSRVLTSGERTLLYNGGAGLTYPFSATTNVNTGVMSVKAEVVPGHIQAAPHTHGMRDIPDLDFILASQIFGS